MRRRTLAVALISTIGALGVISTIAAPQSQGDGQNSRAGCSGMGPWPQGGGMMGGGMMGGGMMGHGNTSMARNHAAMMGGVPAPYTRLSNPLPRTKATLDHGAKVYAENCASCHGDAGLGDGPAGRTLSPPPANLAWLSRMPMSRWDPFMYWTVAEGGAPFGTAMPRFKDNLSKEDTWAVIAYIQARLPPSHPK